MSPRLRAAAPYLFVAMVFLVSRLVYRRVFGITFDESPIGFFIQYIDPWFMKNDLWRSLLYLHHQAPLQNLLVAVFVRSFELEHARIALDTVYASLGFTVVMALVHVMLRTGARPLAAAIISALYAINPTTVLYENWLFYHVPVTCLLLCSLIALLAFYRSGSLRSALAFFSLIALAALFRSTLGPLFMIACVLLLVLRPPQLRSSARRIVLQAAAVPLLVLCANSFKPNLLIGYGYGEALAWGNIVPKVFEALPPDERNRLIREKRVSRAARIFCLTDLRAFGDLRIPHEPTGVPLLDVHHAPNGRWNAHALEYLLIARKYYEPDAKFLLTHYPEVYLKSLRFALQGYLAPCTHDMVLPGTPNYSRLSRIIGPIDAALGPQPRGRLLWLSLWLPALFAYGVYRLLRANDRSLLGRAEQLGIAYALLTIGYVTAVSTLVSFGDFSRYRYDIDPMYLTLGALLGSELLRLPTRLRSALGARSARSPQASRAS